MNKAFTRETDSDNNESERDDHDNSLPGNKNYMTPQGAKKLQEELRRLKSVERPEVVRTVEWAAGNGDRSENGDYTYGKKRLREIDRRIRYLNKRLEALEIVDPEKINSDQALFGATVTFRDENDVEKTFAIVGLDEADVLKKKISWISPLAKALFKAREGDVVQFHSPRGTQEIEIVQIAYRAIEG